MMPHTDPETVSGQRRNDGTEDEPDRPEIEQAAERAEQDHQAGQLRLAPHQTRPQEVVDRSHEDCTPEQEPDRRHEPTFQRQDDRCGKPNDAVPMPGMNDMTTMIAVQNIAPWMPTTANATPASPAWIIPITTAPNSVA